MIESHPLTPFLPKNGQLLFLGSFPPPKSRWSMEWFYPNWINDFWRIMGLIHFDDKTFFEAKEEDGGKHFDRERIIEFCSERGLAFFDTARKVRRLKGNASDEFLEIVEGTDVLELLSQMPDCHQIVTTGGKASEELCSYFEKHGVKLTIPKVGCSTTVSLPAPPASHLLNTIKALTWWRMPSTSRAYPMKIEKKADYYRLLFKPQDV